MKHHIRIQQMIIIGLLLPISCALAMDKQPNNPPKEFLRKPERQGAKVLHLEKGSGDQSPTRTVRFAEPLSSAEQMADAPIASESAAQRKLARLRSLQSIDAKSYFVHKLAQLSTDQQEEQQAEQQIKQVMRELRAQACKVSGEHDEGVPVLIKTLAQVSAYLERGFGLQFIDYENLPSRERLAQSQEHVLAFEPPQIQTDYQIFCQCHPRRPLLTMQESMPLYQVIASGEPQKLASFLQELQEVGGNLRTLGDGLELDQHGFAPLNWVLIPELNITVQARIAMLDMLLKAGADINMPSNFGRTVVHEALLSELPEAHLISEFLYEKYVLCDLIDFGGQTPLHVAVAQGLVQPVTFLLGRKSDLEARDNKHRTPLQVAFDEHLPSKVKAVIVDALIKAGADMEVVDADGNPLIFDVINKVDLAGVELLLGHGANCRNTNLQNHSVTEFAQEKMKKTEKAEVAAQICEVVKEYAEGRRRPRGAAPIPQHISIAIPETLQGKVDVDAFREQIRIMLTTQGSDGTSLLHKALVNSFKKESHAK